MIHSLQKEKEAILLGQARPFSVNVGSSPLETRKGTGIRDLNGLSGGAPTMKNDEILTIRELKILISQEEEQIKEKRQSLKYHEDLLKDLRQRLNNYIVDGLRLQVREFIEVYQGAGLSPKLLRLNTRNLNWCSEHRPERTPYLEGAYGPIITLTEEEAILLASRDGRQAYNIDCSIWDTYRYPGEID